MRRPATTFNGDRLPGRKGRRMLGASLAVVGVAVLALVGATAARADEPFQTTFTLQTFVQDTSVCGFGIRWDISAVAHVQIFSGADGPTFEIEHIREHNLLTNLAYPEKTISDDPVYQEILHLDAQANVTSADVIGLWVNAREGGDSVTDVGRVVIAVNPVDGSHEMVFEAGRHPVREIAQANLQQDLVAFCDLLS